MWTHFWDMSSGGDRKEEWTHIFIEAPETEAKSVFFARFGHNPERITCGCCGDDYSISEYETLDAATAYQRGCDYDGDNHVERPGSKPWDTWRHYRTLDEYLASGDALIIWASEIRPDERALSVPEQGWVWQD